MNKYVTKKGHIFAAKYGFHFHVDHSKGEFEIRRPYSAVVYPTRDSFDNALENDELSYYVEEIYTGLWN